MASNISTSLIISTYNRSDALELCVKSVLRQSLLPDEIIIADDGSKEDTRELIHQLAASSEVPIIHVWHEDLGFRLASIRNKAIAKASKEYIIQIDGDIVLHKDFVKDHVCFAKKGSFVTGSRVLIGEVLTNQMLAEKMHCINPQQRNEEYDQRHSPTSFGSIITVLPSMGHNLFQRMQHGFLERRPIKS